MVRVQVYPVTVCAGSGMVWENPTRGIPVFNSNHVDHVVCEACKVCTPDVCELIFMDNNGTVYMQNISIHTMENVEDVPHGYWY
jgi:hypothetical protein